MSGFSILCQDFVRMMGTELAASSDFSLPEYYFRVSREEDDGNGAVVVQQRGNQGAAGVGSGRFFSRIDRIRWDDM